jgi:hypothetical protein
MNSRMFKKWVSYMVSKKNVPATRIKFLLQVPFAEWLTNMKEEVFILNSKAICPDIRLLRQSFYYNEEKMLKKVEEIRSLSVYCGKPDAPNHVPSCR